MEDVSYKLAVDGAGNRWVCHYFDFLLAIGITIKSYEKLVLISIYKISLQPIKLTFATLSSTSPAHLHPKRTSFSFITKGTLSTPLPTDKRKTK